MSRRIRSSKPIRHGKKWQIRWTDEQGRRHSEVYSSYDDAEYALMSKKFEVEQVLRGLKFRPPPSRTFDELADKWLEVRTSQKRSPKDDVSIIRAHLRPAFSGCELSQISAERIAMLSTDLGSEKAPKTVRNILILLNSMLNQAVEWGWLTKAPKVRRPKVRLFDKDYKWLKTTDERDHFLLAAKTHQWPVTYPMYATAVYTGMRAGELAGLQWDDIDFRPEQRMIVVQRSYNRPTKSGDVRYVPILDQLLPILKEWKLASESKRLVFPNNEGHMWDQSGRIFQEVLRDVIKRGGFPPKYITFHSLRHTFASHWAMNGGNMYALQDIMGHKDAAMTKRYAHLRPDAFDKYWGIMGPTKCRDGEVIEMRKKDEA
jgi:integrase